MEQGGPGNVETHETSATGSWDMEGEPGLGSPKPESDAPQEDPEGGGAPPRRFTPVQRHSVFNRAVRHKSRAGATGGPKRNGGHGADSPENRKSADEPLTSSTPRSRWPLWKIPATTQARASTSSPWA
ncbi:ephexin-1-like [Sorex araneus]|uniref:ephexin-1-like n=1 Tax=Sorex araneus TaxID=42254 RepID=UPI0024338CE4|nr:ephexin-1-like [Sorex araneus]